MGVTVKGITFYNASASGGGEVAGYENSKRHVVRYTLQVDGQGANKLHLIHQFAKENGVSRPTLCVNLSTDPNAYINTNGNASGYLAVMSVRTDINAYEVTLSGLVLVPGKTYYLWVYPKSDTYAWVYYHKGTSYWTLTAYGSVGLAYIDVGNGLEHYQCYVEDGSKWYSYIRCRDDGASWDLGS
jgi:hypothetical protein